MMFAILSLGPLPPLFLGAGVLVLFPSFAEFGEIRFSFVLVIGPSALSCVADVHGYYCAL